MIIYKLIQVILREQIMYKENKSSFSVEKSLAFLGVTLQLRANWLESSPIQQRNNTCVCVFTILWSQL